MSARGRFAAFIVVGGFAAAVNIGARVLFNLAVSYEVAIVLAFPVALSAAFILNKIYVFRSTGDLTAQFVRFLAVNLVALAQVWAVSMILDRLLFPKIGLVWHTEFLAHVLGVLSPIVTSYVAHKRYTFR